MLSLLRRALIFRHFGEFFSGSSNDEFSVLLPKETTLVDNSVYQKLFLTLISFCCLFFTDFVLLSSVRVFRG